MRAVGDLSKVPAVVLDRVIAGVPATLLPEVGGCVHTDLIDAGVIPDPAIGMNETAAEWVSWTDWCCECVFEMAEDHDDLVLCFDCLDTIAVVEVDGTVVGTARSEFVPWAFPVKQLRKGVHTIRVTFMSPLRAANNLARTLGLPHNGDESSPPWHPFNMMRKCASNFGWDWGPRVATCGMRGPALAVGSAPPPMPTVRAIATFDPATFTFMQHGRPVFIKGVNWIPEGLWPRDRTRAKIRARLLQAKAMGCNLIRVWGGGRYESDAFYEICDELGLMVWQDFMFACACYPEEPPLPALIEAEARFQVARLSKHPCVVLWCGGNENHWAYESWGFKARVASGRGWGTKYWQEVLPKIVAELSPHTPYVPDSPWSPPPTHPNAAEVGDRHTWDLFGEDFRTHVPRFCSEFGVQSPSNLETLLEAGILPPADGAPVAVNGALTATKTPLTATIAPLTATNGAPTATIAPLTATKTPLTGTIAPLTGTNGAPTGVGGAPTLPWTGWGALVARQRGPGGMARWYDEFFAKAGVTPAPNFEAWHAAAQRLQADWLYLAIVWLRANAPACGGAVIWQLNDAWPGFSWSLIDSAGREKAAYFAVQRAFADRLVETVPFGGVPHLVAINDTDDIWNAGEAAGLNSDWLVAPRSVEKRPAADGKPVPPPAPPPT